MRVMAAQINPTIADVDGNCQKIIQALKRAKNQGVELVIFPEMTLLGYFPDDLLFSKELIEKASLALEKIAPHTKDLFVAVGLARASIGRDKPLFNSAAIFQEGKMIGYKDKELLPTYDVFDERRYFSPGDTSSVFRFREKRIGVSICEDVWQHQDTSLGYTKDPVATFMKEGIDLLLNLSGSPYEIEKVKKRSLVFQKAAKSLNCPVLFCNQVGANDQLIFDGHSSLFNHKGEIVQMAKGFVEEDLVCDLSEKKEPLDLKIDVEGDLYQALCLGTRDYFLKQGLKKAVIGLSGGLDSALVASIAKDAIGAENVVCIYMPSRFSSEQSRIDAVTFCKKLGVEMKEISIEKAFALFLRSFTEMFQEPLGELVEENLQSRIRGVILMAFSNQFGHIVLNTSNKSELAMGYSTLYGDMVGGFSPLQDVSKSLVYLVAKKIGAIPSSILEKEPSAELKEGQKDTDTLPPYAVLDPILKDLIEEGLGCEEIAKKRERSVDFVFSILEKVQAAEYKRRQAPIGPRVTKKAFGKGRKVPIVTFARQRGSPL